MPYKLIRFGPGTRGGTFENAKCFWPGKLPPECFWLKIAKFPKKVILVYAFVRSRAQIIEKKCLMNAFVRKFVKIIKIHQKVPPPLTIR